MKQSLCLFTIIAFVSFTSAQIDVDLDDPTTILAAKHARTTYRTTTEATNDIPILNPDVVITNSTTAPPLTTTEVPSTTKPQTTTTTTTTTSKTPTTSTPSNNVTTTASPNPTPSNRSYDSFSFFGGLLIGLIVAVAGLFAFKFYKNRDPSYQNL